MVAIAAECLAALGATGWTLVLGHVGVFAALVAQAGLDRLRAALARARVDAKDAAGAREALADARGEHETEAIVQLVSLAGPRAVLDRAARDLAFCAPAVAAVEELRIVADALATAGLDAVTSIDLGQVRGLDYYTGPVFRIYAEGLGLEVGGGGRYDSLLSRFGRPMPAVGFMLGLDRIASLLERQNPGEVESFRRAETVDDADLGAALERARNRRAAGARIRFGGEASR